MAVVITNAVLLRRKKTTQANREMKKNPIPLSFMSQSRNTV